MSFGGCSRYPRSYPEITATSIGTTNGCWKTPWSRRIRQACFGATAPAVDRGRPPSVGVSAPTVLPRAIRPPYAGVLRWNLRITFWKPSGAHAPQLHSPVYRPHSDAIDYRPLGHPAPAALLTGHGSPVHLSAMADLDDNNHNFCVAHFIDDTVCSGAQTKEIRRCELLAPRRTRVFRELFDCAQDPADSFFRNSSKAIGSSLRRFFQSSRSSRSSERTARTASFTSSDMDCRVSAALSRRPWWRSSSR